MKLPIARNVYNNLPINFYIKHNLHRSNMTYMQKHSCFEISKLLWKSINWQSRSMSSSLYIFYTLR